MIKEKVTTDSVRGLGLVSGIPGGSLSNYESNNIATADTINDNLKKFVKL